MRTGFLKRIRVLETKSRRPRWLVCLRDVENDLFIGACGDKISHSQFLEWVQQQDNDTGIILLEVQNENDNLKITVDNYLQYNNDDMMRLNSKTLEQKAIKSLYHDLRTERQREILKHYEEVFQKADEMNLKMKKAELRRQLGLELDDLFVSSYKAKGEE